MSVQISGQGQPTGKVLQCSPDAPVLQQNRADFEAFTLLMCAAMCGNAEELERLLAVGRLCYLLSHPSSRAFAIQKEVVCFLTRHLVLLHLHQA